MTGQPTNPYKILAAALIPGAGHVMLGQAQQAGVAHLQNLSNSHGGSARRHLKRTATIGVPGRPW